MNNFLEATRTRLRVQTQSGALSVEQLWDLTPTKLATIVRNLKKQLKKDDDDELSFLDETKVMDKETQLAFDVVKEIYLVKKEEADKIKTEAERKANNEKIMALIHQKQEQALGEKSIEELKAMLQ